MRGAGLSASGTLSNSGGLQNTNNTYTLTDGTLTLTYAGQQPTSASSITYVENVAGFSDTYSTNGEPAQPLAAAVVCFRAGTMIATATGEIALEALTMGDLVVTASGALRPIR